MELREEGILKIVNALPQSFDFYHLGKVELQGDAFDLLETTAIAFHLFGEFKTLLIILFPPHLDFSTYSELGNILASKTANRLSTESGAEVLVSPPQRLKQKQIHQIAQNGHTIIKKNYSHIYKDLVIPVATWILPSPSEGIGYA